MLRWAVFSVIALTLLCARLAAQTSGTDVTSSATAFAQDPRFADLRITRENGLAIVRGTVKSCEDKRLALRQAASIDGLLGVEDHVEVKTLGITDRVLIRKIGQTLKENNLPGLQVRVSKGIVTVRGRVPNASDRERAVALICGTAGVVDVNDQQVRVLADVRGK
jgi:osmotically-inducible protein OsmY